MTDSFIWRSGTAAQTGAMKRGAAVLALSLLACSSAPVLAQTPGSTGNSELAGAPGWRTEQSEAEKRAAARRQVEDQIARARAKTAEDARLAREAEAREARAAAELAEREAAEPRAAEEERLAELRPDDARGGDARDGDDGARNDGARNDDASNDGEARFALRKGRSARPGMRLDASIDACELAGEDKAIARDYLSARYVRAPRFYERSSLWEGVWELRGVMRVEDWRGSVLAATVCELDGRGEVRYFGFVRP
jgi:hypothetical protein